MKLSDLANSIPTVPKNPYWDAVAERVSKRRARRRRKGRKATSATAGRKASLPDPAATAAALVASILAGLEKTK